jgi:hypothetical protein|tara:strand:- start:3376 stop:3636 length:261 start_codon:yes stop_codon:yes gene_type:complete
MNPVTALKLGLEVFSHIKSKPKTLTKEAAGLTVLLPMASKIYDQYTAGGFVAVDGELISALVGGLWILGVRLYQKHKESNSNIIKP